MSSQIVSQPRSIFVEETDGGFGVVMAPHFFIKKKHYQPLASPRELNIKKLKISTKRKRETKK